MAGNTDILIGGGSKAALRRAGRYGLSPLLAYAGPAEAAERRASGRARCASTRGSSRGSQRSATSGWLRMPSAGEWIRRRLEEMWRFYARFDDAKIREHHVPGETPKEGVEANIPSMMAYGTLGDAEQVLEELSAIVSTGVDELILRVRFDGIDSVLRRRVPSTRRRRSAPGSQAARMSGLRLTVAWPGATVTQLLELAPLAERWNIAGIWVGDPRGQAENSADSYVTAAAAAVSGVTTHLRLGLVLGVRHEKQIVRIAEDVAVVDQASGGRVELAFVPPPQGAEAWREDVARLLRAWTAWDVPGGDEIVPVIPGPAQPFLPRVVVDDSAAADALGAGRMIVDGSTPASGALVPPRTILALDSELGSGGVVEWLSVGPVDRVLDLRLRAREAGAHELLMIVDGFAEADLEALGTVLVPALRAADRDARVIAADAWAWLTEKRNVHAPPA